MPKLLTIFVFLGLSACQPINQTEKISGHTMGTTYTIIAQTNQLNQQAIERRLNQITQVFSSWDYNSELSILNRQAINTPKSVSAEMAFVLAQAINVHKQTEGFFNPAMGELIDIWGFGVNPVERSPSQLEIEDALKRASMKQLSFRDSKFLKKADAKLNLSAIAKGYAVDEIAKLLKKQNIDKFMVEIGGEIKTQGRWSVGIESPAGQAPIAIDLVDESIATSGNYRQYFVWKAKRYAHILDPHTGLPVDSDLFSASVIHPSNMLADAYATAMMAMGKDEAVKMARRLNLKAVFVLDKCEHPCSNQNIIKVGL